MSTRAGNEPESHIAGADMNCHLSFERAALALDRDAGLLKKGV